MSYNKIIRLIIIANCFILLSCFEGDDDVFEYEFVNSTNLLDTKNMVKNHHLLCDGTVCEDNNYSYTNFISVKCGDTIIIGNGFKDKRFFRYVSAYDYHKKILKESGKEQVMYYVVPPRVSYIRASIYNDDLDSTTRINKGSLLLRYEPFKVDYFPKGTYEKRLREYKLKNMPLT